MELATVKRQQAVFCRGIFHQLSVSMVSAIHQWRWSGCGHFRFLQASCIGSDKWEHASFMPT